MVVDLGAAADFGVTIPPDVIARASAVIPGEAGDTAGVASTEVAGAARANRAAAPWEFWLSALVLGLAFAPLAWGVYIASRVLRFPGHHSRRKLSARRRGGCDAHRRRYGSAPGDDRGVLRRNGCRLRDRLAAHATSRHRAPRRAFS